MLRASGLSVHAPRWRLSRLAGLAGTLLLHILLLRVALLGSQGITVPARRGAPSPALILLQPSAAAPRPGLAATEPLAGSLKPTEARPTVISADPTPLFTQLTDAAQSTDGAGAGARGDPAEQARLFALYTAQVQSRIAQVWRRPRSPIGTAPPTGTGNDGVFRCEAVIRQDTEHRIQEIRMPSCNGSRAWQMSLAKAIVAAGPLPPPPDGLTFSDTLSLSFIGFAYAPGASAGEYEPPP